MNRLARKQRHEIGGAKFGAKEAEKRRRHELQLAGTRSRAQVMTAAMGRKGFQPKPGEVERFLGGVRGKTPQEIASRSKLETARINRKRLEEEGGFNRRLLQRTELSSKKQLAAEQLRAKKGTQQRIGGFIIGSPEYHAYVKRLAGASKAMGPREEPKRPLPGEESRRGFETGRLGAYGAPGRTIPGTGLGGAETQRLQQQQLERRWREQETYPGQYVEPQGEPTVEQQVEQYRQQLSANMERSSREAKERGQRRAIGDTANMRDNLSMFLDDADAAKLTPTRPEATQPPPAPFVAPAAASTPQPIIAPPAGIQPQTERMGLGVIRAMGSDMFRPKTIEEEIEASRNAGLTGIPPQDMSILGGPAVPPPGGPVPLQSPLQQPTGTPEEIAGLEKNIADMDARLTALRQAGAGVPTIAAGGISSWGGGEMNEADRMEMNALSHTLANATDPVQRQRIMQQIQDLRRRIAGEPVQPQGKPVASTVGSPTDQPLTEGERERMANISQRVVNEIKKPETGFWTVFEGGASDVLNRQADDLVTNITGILDSAPPMRRRQVARDIATRVGHSELLDDIKSFRNWSLLDTINIAASGNKFTAKDAKKFADKLQKIYDLLAKELGR